MAQNLFVGSLAYATTDDSLKAHFEQVGEVASARVITDRDSGRSKGFGFVEFVDEANNQKAVDELDGKDVVFHATGGTKLMVLAIHQQLLNLAAGEGRYRLLYADTAHQTLSWLDEQPR